MKESTTYQMILAEGEQIGRADGERIGRADGERRTILRIGEKRFGIADTSVRSRLNAITDTDVLERLVDRLLTVESWDELFAL